MNLNLNLNLLKRKHKVLKNKPDLHKREMDLSALKDRAIKKGDILVIFESK